MTDAEAAALGRFLTARLRWQHARWLARYRAAQDAGATPQQRSQARVDAFYLRRDLAVLAAVWRDGKAAWREQRREQEK